MTTEKPCKKCGEVKPLDAYRMTPNGKHQITCRACQIARAKARHAERMRTEPEYAEKTRKRQREAAARAYAAKAPGRNAARASRAATMSEEDRERAEAEAAERRRAAARAAERAAASAKLAIEAASVERRINESGLLDRKCRFERDDALRDALWGTLRETQERRAEHVASADPAPASRLKLRGGRGYISIAEFAVRCAEREACKRASASRKLLPAACEVIALLEQDTTGASRRGALQLFPTGGKPPASAVGDLETPDVDPFADAFGDWAAWAGNEGSSWSASLAV